MAISSWSTCLSLQSAVINKEAKQTDVWLTWSIQDSKGQVKAIVDFVNDKTNRMIINMHSSRIKLSQPLQKWSSQLYISSFFPALRFLMRNFNCFIIFTFVCLSLHNHLMFWYLKVDTKYSMKTISFIQPIITHNFYLNQRLHNKFGPFNTNKTK